MKKFRSKWFRVAVEGATTDGRRIEGDWIDQMAASYDRSQYGARVWMEHIRGTLAVPTRPVKSGRYEARPGEWRALPGCINTD